MDADDDVVLSDENLEGDCGSDFGDMDFPSEWTVLDDADEDEEEQEQMTVVEEVGEEDMQVEEKSKSSSKKVEEKKPEEKTVDKKPEEKTTDKKKATEKKPEEKTTEQKPSEKKSDEKTTEKKSEKKSDGKTTDTKKTPEKKTDTKKETVTPDKKSNESKKGKGKGTEDDPIDLDDPAPKITDKSLPKSKTPENKPKDKKKEIEDDLENIEADMGEEDEEVETKKETRSSSRSRNSSRSSPRDSRSSKDTKPTSQSSKSSSTSQSSTKKDDSKPKTETSKPADKTETPKECPKKDEKPKTDAKDHGKPEADKKDDALKKYVIPKKDETTPKEDNLKSDAKSSETKKNDTGPEKAKEKYSLGDFVSMKSVERLSKGSHQLTTKLKLAFGDLDVKEPENFKQSWDNTPKWHMAVSPIELKDLSMEGLKRVINLSQHSAFFMLGDGYKKEGCMAFLFSQFQDVQIAINKLSCIGFACKTIKLNLARKKSYKAYDCETAEMSIVTNSATNLTIPVRGKAWIAEGKLKNRQLNLNNVPVGTSKQMLEVMFPYTVGVKFQSLQAKEMSGMATMECTSTAMARSVKKCYASIKIGIEHVELSRVIEDKDEKDEATKPSPNKPASKDSPRRTDRKRESTERRSSRDGRSGSRSDTRNTNRGDNRNDNRNGNRTDFKSGRKPDARVSLRQEQAKKIRDRSRNMLTQNRKDFIARKQEQAMQQIQQRQMQIQQQQQQMAMQKNLMMQQQMQAVQQQKQQQQLALAQAQAQAQMLMEGGGGVPPHGAAPVEMGGPQTMNPQSQSPKAAIPSHIQVSPGINLANVISQQEARFKRPDAADNINVMARANMNRQNQFNQEVEPDRGDMFRQGNRMDAGGFNQQHMNRNEGLLARPDANMMKRQDNFGHNEPMNRMDEPFNRNEAMGRMNQEDAFAHNEPVNRMNREDNFNRGEQRSRFDRAEPAGLGGLADRTRGGAQAVSQHPAAGRQGRFDQGQGQQYGEEWGDLDRQTDEWRRPDYPEDTNARKQSFDQRGGETDRRGQDYWDREQYREQDYNYEEAQTYSAGMKRPGLLQAPTELQEKRQRMDQRSQYRAEEESHQHQDLDWSRPDDMDDRHSRQYDDRKDRQARSQPAWGTQAVAEAEDQPYEIHDYGHHSQDWDDNRQDSWEQPSMSQGGLLPAPVGILKKGAGKPRGALAQRNQGMGRQNQQNRQQNQMQQRQQNQFQQRQQKGMQQQRQRGGMQQRGQRGAGQQQQQQAQGGGGGAQQQQQAMMQQQMMQAAGRFQPKMVLLPTRSIPGMKRN